MLIINLDVMNFLKKVCSTLHSLEMSFYKVCRGKSYVICKSHVQNVLKWSLDSAEAQDGVPKTSVA